MLPVPFVYEAWFFCLYTFYMLFVFVLHFEPFKFMFSIFFSSDKKVWNQVLILKAKIWFTVLYYHGAPDMGCLKIRLLSEELPISKAIFCSKFK